LSEPGTWHRRCPCVSRALSSYRGLWSESVAQATVLHLRFRCRPRPQKHFGLTTCGVPRTYRPPPCVGRSANSRRRARQGRPT
jgi:hypothetical protein